MCSLLSVIHTKNTFVVRCILFETFQEKLKRYECITSLAKGDW
jgi:hypothetical protein